MLSKPSALAPTTMTTSPVASPGPQSQYVECEECQAFVGGVAGDEGWLGTLDADGLANLQPFQGTGFVPLRVQDILISRGASDREGEGRLLLAGVDENDTMTIVEIDPDGLVIPWYPVVTDKPPRSTRGIFRGIAEDEEGSIYAAGVINDQTRSGVLIKFDASADIVNFREWVPDTGDSSFHDVVITRTGAGALAGETVTSSNVHRWLQATFKCERGTPKCE